MHTMDVFVVYSWERGEDTVLQGIYQRKSDAEYIRDHLTAINYDRRLTAWKSRSNPKYYAPPPLEVSYGGYYIDEEEVYLA